MRQRANIPETEDEIAASLRQARAYHAHLCQTEAVPAPCPWCESAGGLAIGSNWVGMFYDVTCSGCGASGPHAPTARLAVQMWNALTLRLLPLHLVTAAGPAKEEIKALNGREYKMQYEGRFDENDGQTAKDGER